MNKAEQIVDMMADSGKFYHVNSQYGITELSECKYVMFDRLKNLPEENLNEIYRDLERKIDLITRKSCDEFMQDLAGSGLLKMTPYIHRYLDKPVLVLKHNRYLKLNKNGYFTVMYTCDGAGIYQQANVSVSELYSMFKYVQNSDFFQIMVYMTCINACAEIDAFADLLKTNSSLVDEFIKESVKDYVTDFHCTYADVMSCIMDTTHSNKIITNPCKVFNVKKSDTMDLCRVSVYNTQNVMVECMFGDVYRSLLVNLRKLDNSKSLFLDDDTVTELHNNVNNLTVLYVVASFAMNCAGFVVNHNSVHSIVKDRKGIKALNSNTVNELVTLDSFTSIAPPSM